VIKINLFGKHGQGGRPISLETLIYTQAGIYVMTSIVLCKYSSKWGGNYWYQTLHYQSFFTSSFHLKISFHLWLVGSATWQTCHLH